MVCEPSSAKPLRVSRRGSFFEDPFFRDAWQDYSHAVRRIVDRFNHGWVSPSERLRDSHYHSMYRTLRSARQNYATHSAKFKDENGIYKLVMDVREFVGGDITVRTAGGSVSVRGKVEDDIGEGLSRGKERWGDKKRNETTTRVTVTKEDLDEDMEDDTTSSAGTGKSCRSLHRRFALPADADSEKMESQLSRDAVLSITIPKRSDVRYIPVTLEDENMQGSSGNKNCRGETHKRPFDSSHDSSTDKSNKKFQEGKTCGKNREILIEKVGKQIDHRKDSNKMLSDPKGKCEKMMEKIIEIKTDFEDNIGNKVCGEKPCLSQPKTISISNTETKCKDNNKNLELNSQSKRSRPKGSKYETVCEINIPVTFETINASQKIFKPTKISDDEENQSKVDPKIEEKESIDRPLSKVSTNKGTDSNNLLVKDFKEDTKLFYEDTNKDMNHEILIKENINSQKLIDGSTSQENEMSCRNKVDVVNEASNVIVLDYPKNNTCTADTSPNKICKNCDNKRYNKDSDHICHEKHKFSDNLAVNSEMNKDAFQDLKEDQLVGTQSNKTNKSLHLNIAKDSKDISSSPPASTTFSPPISPGGRYVPVEKRQSLLEDDIFHDCWNDFSNTLNDVLQRLQELSNELSSTKLLTTPVTPASGLEKEAPIQVEAIKCVNVSAKAVGLNDEEK